VRSLSKLPPAESGFYEQVTCVKGIFVFLFLASFAVVVAGLVDPHAVLPRVSIRTLGEPFEALCRMGSEGEVDAASFRPTL
jgi:hypothetical protein